MPVWAAVVIALGSGICGGLLGTLAKIADERGAEVRREIIRATQDFAALATDWFAAVDAAITQNEKNLGGSGELAGEDDDVELKAARAVIHQAGTRLDRLAVLVGPTSELVQAGAKTLDRVSRALDVLPDVPFTELMDIDLDEDERALLDEELGAMTEEERDDHTADVVGDLFDQRIALARALHRRALEHWGQFASVASRELRRGLMPRLRSDEGLA